jgi:hypothetical protein
MVYAAPAPQTTPKLVIIALAVALAVVALVAVVHQSAADSGTGTVPSELFSIPPPPASILPKNGYKGYQSWYLTRDGVTTYTYKITRLDGSTYTKVIKTAAPPPPAAWANCGVAPKCKPTAAEFSAAKKQAASVGSLNTKALKYIYSQFGKQVFTVSAWSNRNKGECWDLGAEAWKQAGAKGPNRYIWSSKPVSLAKCKAGDVLQFKWAKFHTKITHANGEWYEWYKNAGSAASDGEHTAVVFDNLGNKQISVMEQNVNGIRKVQFNTYDFNAMTYGLVQCYQPVRR